MPLPSSIAVEKASMNVYAKEGLKIFAVSLFIAICSQISIPLFFSPVPFSFQTFAIALAGWMLGSKRGALAVLLYLAEGTMGLPVFTNAGSGLAVLLGPRCGYLIGFVPAAWISGYLTRSSTDILRLAIGFLASSATIYLFGLPWLSLWVGKDQALQLGLYPFIIGDLLKIGLAISCVKIWAANRSEQTA